MKKKDLLALIQDLQNKVSKLEAQVANLQFKEHFDGPVYGPLVKQPCFHEYPSPWMATVPPTCKKCGEQASPFIINCEMNNESQSLIDLKKFMGNL